MREVTREQAAAFLEALLGWEDVAEQQARPVSPAALRHLEAVFGYGNLPNSYSIGCLAAGTAKRQLRPEDTSKWLQLADYLGAVAEVIRQEVQGDA